MCNRVGHLLGRAGAALEHAGRAKLALVRRLSVDRGLYRRASSVALAPAVEV